MRFEILTLLLASAATAVFPVSVQGEATKFPDWRARLPRSPNGSASTTRRGNWRTRASTRFRDCRPRGTWTRRMPPA